MEGRQDWLLPYENPLEERVGRGFFSSIPRAPGVYWMLGRAGRILYVGKAKDLRERLRSYRAAKPGMVSPKVIRLVHLIREIRWQVCESEEGALLRENELLRDLQPPFNVVNTRPRLYYFVNVRRVGSQVHLRLATDAGIGGERAFGAFKGRGSVRSGFESLLRAAWAAYRPHGEARFEIPIGLLGDRAPDFHVVHVSREAGGGDEARALERRIAGFLEGRSATLARSLEERIAGDGGIPEFHRGILGRDLEELRDFFRRGPRLNWRLRRFHGIEEPLIAQDRIDDLLVPFRLRLPASTSK